MPDLNLQDDGSLDNLDNSEERTEETTTPEDGDEKKGGMMTILLVVLAVLIVGGGGAFLLDRLGVVHIFGKKKPVPMATQAESQATSPELQQTPSGDAGKTKMLETPPVQQGKAFEKKGATKASPGSTPPAGMREMPATASSGKLQEMKGEYTIQVSAWRDKEIAEELVKRLADAGYPAFVEDREYKDATWHTVRVGRYPSRKDAETAVQNFAEELRSNYWIDKAKAK